MNKLHFKSFETKWFHCAVFDLSLGKKYFITVLLLILVAFKSNKLHLDLIFYKALLTVPGAECNCPKLESERYCA